MTSTVAASRRIFDPRQPRFVLQLALLSFVVVVHSDVKRAIVGVALASLGILVGELIENRWFWWGVVVIMGGWFLAEWQVLDNHVALSVYWAISVALALSSRDWRANLPEIARWIIVTVFSLAVFWKLASPDFLSGNFFEWTLLVDPRFEPIVRLLGVSQQHLVGNRELVALGEAGALVSSSRVSVAASALTIGTIVLESAVAVAWAFGEKVGDTRHWLLGAFAVVTYVMVPVAGFGFVLLTIGAATVDTVSGRRGYALGAAALFVYSALWTLLVL